MKNNKIKIALIACTFSIMQDCQEYIDVVPDNIAVIEDAFASRLTSQRFLATLYNHSPSMLPRGGWWSGNTTTEDAALPASDEIWLNSAARTRGIGGDNIPVNQILTVGNNIQRPYLDAWGSGAGNNMFIGIRDCNIFLKNIDVAYDLEEDEKQIWIAEAKFLKAYFNFFLMRMYGPLPIIKENLLVSSRLEEVRVSRENVDKVADYIVELLDEAILSLPDYVDDLMNLGRATKVMAAVLKARTLMLVASPLFNGNPDYAGFVNAEGEELISTTFDQAKWERAEAACLEAINISTEAGHMLYTTPVPPPDWSDITRIKMDIRGSITDPWNNELLWPSGENTYSIQLISRPRLSQRASINKTATGYWAPTMRIAEMFYSKNGVPIDEDTSYNYDGRFNIVENVTDHTHYIGDGFDAPSLHLNREPRFYASLGFDGGVWLGDQVGSKLLEIDEHVVRAKEGELSHKPGVGQFAFSQTGYFAKKLSNPKTFQGGTGETNVFVERYPFPVARLAGLYLLYAEALNENGKTTEAHIWIDKVRERANLQGVVQSWANHSRKPAKPTTKEGFREIVQHERMIELVFEGQRFWDIRRWKRGIEFLNRSIRGWNRLSDNTLGYYRVTSFWSLEFTKRDYLWPIGQQDLLRNPNLIQNPGW